MFAESSAHAWKRTQEELSSQWLVLPFSMAIAVAEQTWMLSRPERPAAEQRDQAMAQ